MIDGMGEKGLSRIGRLLADLNEGQQRAFAKELLADPAFEQGAQRLLATSPRSVHLAIGRVRSELARGEGPAGPPR